MTGVITDGWLETLLTQDNLLSTITGQSGDLALVPTLGGGGGGGGGSCAMAAAMNHANSETNLTPSSGEGLACFVGAMESGSGQSGNEGEEEASGGARSSSHRPQRPQAGPSSGAGALNSGDGIYQRVRDLVLSMRPCVHALYTSSGC